MKLQPKETHFKKGDKVIFVPNVPDIRRFYPSDFKKLNETGVVISSIVETTVDPEDGSAPFRIQNLTFAELMLSAPGYCFRAMEEPTQI